MEPERVDQDLRVVLGELEDLPEHAEDWDPERVNDAQDAYESYWPSVALDRMNDLERAHRAGEMNAVQEGRYAGLKALLRELMPLIERYGLERPRVPLKD